MDTWLDCPGWRCTCPAQLTKYSHSMDPRSVSTAITWPFSTRTCWTVVLSRIWTPNLMRKILNTLDVKRKRLDHHCVMTRYTFKEKFEEQWIPRPAAATARAWFTSDGETTASSGRCSAPTRSWILRKGWSLATSFGLMMLQLIPITLEQKRYSWRANNKTNIKTQNSDFTLWMKNRVKVDFFSSYSKVKLGQNTFKATRTCDFP